MNRFQTLAAGLLVCTAVAAPAAAADLARGEQLAQGQCASCHGKDFASPIDKAYPRLAGQYADYLEVALRDYQSGARTNAIMAGMAKPLSRQDIRDISAYLASLPGPLSNTKR